MKARIICKIIFILILCFNYTHAQTLTLQHCIDQAIANNISVKQSGLLVENAEINLSQAKSNLLPNLNGGFNYGFNSGRSVDPITNNYITQQLFSSNLNLSSGIIVYNGLRLKNVINQNAMNVEAVKMDFNQVKSNLTLNVILAYLQVLSNEDVLAVMKKQMESTQKQIERMSILIKEGSAGNYQLSDLKGQQDGEEINSINLQNNLQQSKLDLCRFMQIDFNPNLQLERADAEMPTQLYVSNASEVYNTALQTLPIIKANEFKIKTAEYGIKIAKAGFFPTVSFNANLGSSYSSLAQKLSPTTVTENSTGDYVLIGGNQNAVLRKNQNYDKSAIGYLQQLNNNLGTFAGVNASIPIFNNFLVKNRKKIAEFNLKNIQFDAEYTNFLLKQNIEQAWLNLNNTFNRYQILQNQVKNFEESFRAAEVRFKNGVINATEFLIAKNNLDRTKIGLSQTKYEYLFREKLLDFYQGR